MAKHIIGTIEGILLFILLLAAGYGVCILPGTTTSLARISDQNIASPFTSDQLVGIAEVTQEYTIFTNDKEALYSALADINAKAQTPYAEADISDLLNAPDQYTLTADAISHLDDVYKVVQGAHVVIVVSLLMAFIMAIVLFTFKKEGTVVFGRALLIASAVLLVLIFSLGVWALVDFDSLFALFHSLFFAEGTWLFSASSLLISMYPLSFWTGMALVWFSVTAGLCILSIILGRFLGFNKKHRSKKAR